MKNEIDIPGVIKMKKRKFGGKISGITLFFVAVTTLLILPGNICAQQDEPSPDVWSKESMLTTYMVMGYGYPREMVVTLGKYIGKENNDDVSVCLYLGRKTQLDPRNIMGLKRKGLSWKKIMQIINFDPQQIFKEIGFDYFSGVPSRFRHSFGEYKKWKKNPAYAMGLTDSDVRDLVQLRFVMKMFGVTAQQMMKARSSGADWITIILAGGR